MPKITETDLIINPDGSVYHLNLKPEHVSEKIITVGDPSRVHRISSHFDKIEFEMNKREFITHTGTYKGKRLTVISTGMGTDNVEIMLNELDALFNINLKTREVKDKLTKLRIVRVGTSGSIQEDMRLGSHVLSEYGIGLDPMMLFYDFHMEPFESAVAEALQKELSLPYCPYIAKGSEELTELFRDVTTSGNTLTCHGFYGPQGRSLRAPIKDLNFINKLNYFHYQDFWITNLEMETAGYYGLAKLLGHEMISLNAIIANRVRNRFSKDPNKVIDALIRKVLEKI